MDSFFDLSFTNIDGFFCLEGSFSPNAFLEEDLSYSSIPIDLVKIEPINDYPNVTLKPSSFVDELVKYHPSCTSKNGESILNIADKFLGNKEPSYVDLFHNEALFRKSTLNSTTS